MPNTNLQRFLFLLLICCLSIHLTRSFWLDEAITAWISSGTLSQTFHRAYEFQGQSPFYFILIHIWTAIFDRAEWIFRLPNLILLVMGGHRLGKIALLFKEPQVAHLAPILLLAVSCFFPDTLYARPYSLAICAVIFSEYFLLRTLDSLNWRSALGYILSSAIVFYAHYLFAACFALHAATVLLIADDKRRSFLRWINAQLLILLLCLPGLVQLKFIFGHRALYEMSPLPSFQSLLSRPNPAHLGLLAVLLCTSIFLLSKCRRSWRTTINPQFLALSAMWWLLPSVILFALAAGLQLHVFESRYSLWLLPGLALNLSLFIAALPATWFQKSLLILISAGTGGLALASNWMAQDWRGGIEYLNQTTSADDIVLAWPGLIESKDPTWVRDPRKSGYLLSAITVYQPRGKLILLPWDPFNVPDFLLTKELAKIGVVANPQTLRLIFQAKAGKFSSGTTRNDENLGRWLKSEGYRLDSFATFEDICVARFRHEQNS